MLAECNILHGEFCPATHFFVVDILSWILFNRLGDFNQLSPADKTIFFSKQCRSWWDGSSASTLFVIRYWFLTETPIWSNGSGKIQRWKSPLQKLGDERVDGIFHVGYPFRNMLAEWQTSDKGAVWSEWTSHVYTPVNRNFSQYKSEVIGIFIILPC